MTVRSNSLFHFTRSIDTLKLVLKNGFWPRYCLEDCHWHGIDWASTLAYPMVCFCDIPIGRIRDHTDFYGSFGIGLTKEWALRNQLNPITYISPNSPLKDAVKQLINVSNQVPGEELEAAHSVVRTIFSFVKPLSGVMVVSGKPTQKDFYQESEWRHVPHGKEIDQHLVPDEFNDPAVLEQHNQKTRNHCMLKFAANDIRYIFVPVDSDIPAVMNFIQAELGEISNADLKVLMSRVTSLESLQNDI